MKYTRATRFEIKKDFQSQHDTEGFKKSAVDDMDQEKLISDIEDAGGFDEEEDDNNDVHDNVLESGDDTEDSLPKPRVVLTSRAETNHTSSSTPLSQSRPCRVRHDPGHFRNLNNGT